MADRSPLAAHAASPAELRARIDAERLGRPFLVLRDGDGAQTLVELDGELHRLSVGRGTTCDVALGWDDEVSRLHAELELIAGEWTVSDDGLSRNGTYVRLKEERELGHGDYLFIGRKLLRVEITAA